MNRCLELKWDMSLSSTPKSMPLVLLSQSKIKTLTTSGQWFLMILVIALHWQQNIPLIKGCLRNCLVSMTYAVGIHAPQRKTFFWENTLIYSVDPPSGWNLCAACHEIYWALKSIKPFFNSKLQLKFTFWTQGISKILQTDLNQILLADRNIPFTFSKAIFKVKYWPRPVPLRNQHPSPSEYWKMTQNIMQPVLPDIKTHCLTYYLCLSFNIKRQQISLTVAGDSTPASRACWQNPSDASREHSCQRVSTCNLSLNEKTAELRSYHGEQLLTDDGYESMLIKHQQHPMWCVSTISHLISSLWSLTWFTDCTIVPHCAKGVLQWMQWNWDV